MQYNELINGFAARLGIEGVRPENGTTMLEVDNMRFAITSQTDGGIMLYGILGEAAPDASEHLCRMLLEANHLLTATKGATLCRDPETGEFALCRELAHADHLDVEGFSAAFQDFVDTAEVWHKAVVGLSSAETHAVNPEEWFMPHPITGHNVIHV